MRENRMKAVLFDMDGVIFDTERLFTDCFLQVSDAAGHLNRKEIEKMLDEMRGRNGSDCQKIALHYLHDIDTYRQLSGQADLRFKNVIQKNGMPVKSGISDLFAWLQDHSVLTALVTSTDRDRVQEYFQHTGLAWIFDTSVCGLEIERGKPEPDCYLTAADKLGVCPDECAVIEDSLPGIRAGIAAGASVIMIPDMTPPDAYASQNCLAIVKDGAEIIQILESTAYKSSKLYSYH